ncbi:hypothetical protein [Chengkuizengella sediminis]|uniref:hypothetical protein n=1 Tax=Chengkuizengella sediminis TaxID=1885917 RepID=UPI00138A3094|nr:hypothetical protein [Chengkuizengella sediminis]NDI34111.1 hypothetical protein [Chengkuizengella sediminis]
MSYEEKNNIVSLISTILISSGFFIYVLQNYQEGSLDSANVFNFWGSVFFLLIIVTIVSNIILHIIFGIINTIATKEEIPSISDERDKLIELKATRNSYYVFVAGFLLAMGSLVFDMSPNVMFSILFISGSAASMMDSISKLYFYRRGF